MPLQYHNDFHAHPAVRNSAGLFDLSHMGEIYPFNSLKTLVRWSREIDDHDLARVSTWEELVSAANAGELKVYWLSG